MDLGNIIDPDQPPSENQDGTCFSYTTRVAVLRSGSLSGPPVRKVTRRAVSLSTDSRDSERQRAALDCAIKTLPKAAAGVLLQWQKVVKGSGVYLALSNWGEVLYVGQSLQVQERVKSHKRSPWYGSERATWLMAATPVDRRRQVEEALIAWLHPKLNAAKRRK